MTEISGPDQKNSRKSSAQEELYLVFLDTMEQQQTPKSNHTVVTESTTTTLQSTPRVPKKRRLFLRSARNKVQLTKQTNFCSLTPHDSRLNQLIK